MRLYNLPTTDNDIFQKSVKIEENALDSVDSNFYATTVFNDYKGFQKSMSRFEKYLFGSIRKELVETPLIPERGNARKTFFAKENKGVAWGFRLVDYRSNKPLLTVVVDKVGAQYSYTSVIYNKGTKQFEDSQSALNTASDKEAVLSFVEQRLREDVAKFNTAQTV